MTDEEKREQFNRVMLYNNALLAEFRKIRKSNASKSGLARDSGVTRQQIAKYESGETMPSVGAMNRLLDPMGYELKIVRQDSGSVREQDVFYDPDPLVDEKEACLSVAEFAQKVGVSRQTVYNWIEAGILKPEQRGNRLILREDDLWRTFRKLINWYLSRNDRKREETQ